MRLTCKECFSVTSETCQECFSVTSEAAVWVMGCSTGVYRDENDPDADHKMKGLLPAPDS